MCAQGDTQIAETSLIWLSNEFEPLFLTNVSSYINKWHDLLYVPPALLQISELKCDTVRDDDGVRRDAPDRPGVDGRRMGAGGRYRCVLTTFRRVLTSV